MTLVNPPEKFISQVWEFFNSILWLLIKFSSNFKTVAINCLILRDAGDALCVFPEMAENLVQRT